MRFELTSEERQRLGYPLNEPLPELPAAHAQIVDAVTRDGERWISQTIVNGHSVLRMMIISYLTTEDHIYALQNALVASARSLNLLSS